MDESIVTFRVRLARNLRGHKFPVRMQNGERAAVIGEIAQNVTSLTYVPLNKDNRDTARALMEQHLISPDFAGEEAAHGVLLSADKRVSIMLCEEDHLRIQVFGTELRQCLQTAQEFEDLIDKTHPFAFDESLGFLTACPTNLGTGLRASALMHLPALTEANSMRRLIQQAGASGLAVRGFYGEGTQAAWGYYQISNSVTLGLCEQEIINALEEITGQIAELEQRARQAALKKDPVGFADRIWRAVGTLTNARRISTKEAMECLSTARLGAVAKTFGGLDVQTIDKLSQQVWPGMLTQAHGTLPGEGARDEARAQLLRGIKDIIQ